MACNWPLPKSFGPPDLVMDYRARYDSVSMIWCYIANDRCGLLLNTFHTSHLSAFNVQQIALIMRVRRSSLSKKGPRHSRFKQHLYGIYVNIPLGRSGELQFSTIPTSACYILII